MECDKIDIYDINLNRIGSLFTWVSMVWNEGYNTLGYFQLEAQCTDQAVELIQKDHYCGISASDTLMLIESIQVRNNTIIANGFPATIALSHRVSTTEISYKNAETAMRSLIDEMEPWPCIELGESAGLTTRFTPQTSDQTIEEYCEIIGQETDIGFKLVHDRNAKKLLFTCYQPEADPNAKYSTLYGNVGEITYSLSDVDYKNVAIVAGSGEGDERITVVAGDTESTGADRREMYIDARNVQPEDEESEADYEARLIAYGEGKLIEQAKINNLNFEISNDISLGNIAFVNIPELNVKLWVRITGITITSQNNGTTLELSLGEPVILRRN